MAFEYSCFISYRSAQHELTRRFVEDLCSALSGELETHTGLPVFVDKDRLRPGFLFNAAIAKALCKSVSMVMVYTRHYFDLDSMYCAREFAGMAQLEARRFQALGIDGKTSEGLIIPMIFRGKDFLPADIRDHRQYYDFQEFTLSSRHINRHPEYSKVIQSVAEYIADRCLQMEGVADKLGDCDDYELPAEDDIRSWVETIVPGSAGFP